MRASHVHEPTRPLPNLKHSCIIDVRPSLARRPRPGRVAGQCIRPRRRAQHTRTDYERRVAHPHSHDTTHRPRTATGARHPGRAAWAIRLPGRRRGRRVMPAEALATVMGGQQVCIQTFRPDDGGGCGGVIHRDIFCFSREISCWRQIDSGAHPSCFLFLVQSSIPYHSHNALNLLSSSTDKVNR